MAKETIKIIMFDDINNVKYVDVPVSKKFEHHGYTWVIHRHGRYILGKDRQKRWVVSEYQTGMRCLVTEKKLADVEKHAKNVLDGYGAERTEKAVDLAIKNHGVVNE